MENAIIKIPGMSYQPPLIGSKQILNFTAHSWPGSGGYAIMLVAGGVVHAGGVQVELRERADARPKGVRAGHAAAAVL
jgi:copper chaperone NosL